MVVQVLSDCERKPPRQCPTKKDRLAIATLRAPDVRRPSDRKCKVVGTDTRTMRRYAYLQYYIKYCFIHLPPPCPSSTSPQLRSTFDAVSWDDFCQMGVQLYLDSTTSEHLASRTLRKSAQLTAFKCLPFRSLGRKLPVRVSSQCMVVCSQAHAPYGQMSLRSNNSAHC